MPTFILVRQLVVLVWINSALIMSLPAQTINKTPLNSLEKILTYTEIMNSTQSFPLSEEVVHLLLIQLNTLQE